jgi:hypothetical protein
MKISPDRPTIEAAADDIEILRRFEPVQRYAKGEPFFASDVERYVSACSLWAHYPSEGEVLLVPEGQMTLEKLSEPFRGEPGSFRFLRFGHPLTLAESAQVLSDVSRLRRETSNVFVAGQGRLARGGLLPRLMDAGFAASLLLRGKVPGADAAAAELKYHALQEADEKYCYHGRVVRQNGWTILQYWFFMAFNNWRSGFDGVNDHESDWEMILVYLYEQDGLLAPEWVAYASHDFHGADLRRRWDDLEQLDRVDGHPVVYAGAGSHASYFRLGEYQADVSLPMPTLVTKALRAWRHFWVDLLGQPDSGQTLLRAPFVDYARADGLSIGPGQDKEWSPVVISEEVPWVSKYEGLWGLYARDPLSGENAPAGPMFNRDGTPRASWFDPLGFSELDKVAPPPQQLALLEQRRAELAARQEALGQELEQKSGQLQRAGVELQAMQSNPQLSRRMRTVAKSADALAKEATNLRREQAQNSQMLDVFNEQVVRFKAGEREPAQAHIRHMAMPVPLATQSFNRAVEAWAAISISLLLLGIAALLVIAPQHVGLAALALVAAFLLFEALLRGAFEAMVGNIAVALALATAVILIFTFHKAILVGGLAGLAIVLLVQKVRDLRT